MNFASWLGLSARLGLREGGPNSSTKRITVKQFRVRKDGYDSPIVDEDEGDMEQDVVIKETFNLDWTLLFGGLSAELSAQDLSLGEVSKTDEVTTRADIPTASSRDELEREILFLREKLRAKDGEVQRLRDNVLDAVI